MFETVLIANRGEIAVRVIRTLRRMGIRSVAVYSDADAGARHVREADTAVRLGPAPVLESYLSIPTVLEAAAVTGAQAIHPGYGFLSENAGFAAACERAGVVFIGPPTRAIEVMGDKISAKNTVTAFEVPVVPGIAKPGLSDDELVAAAAEIGYPVLIKPSAGGGGGATVDAAALEPWIAERLYDLAFHLVDRRCVDEAVHLGAFLAGVQAAAVDQPVDELRVVAARQLRGVAALEL